MITLDSNSSRLLEANKICALCSLSLPSHSIVEGDLTFCCTGCHAVFNILTSKNQLDNFSQHPLFIEALRSGLISNPALIEQIRQQRAEIIDAEREKLHLEVGDMWCPSCAEIIRLMLLKEKGVLNCVVDYATDLASIEFSPRYLSKEKIYEVIRQLGYVPAALDSTTGKAVSSILYLRFIIAAFCALNIMMLSYPLYAIYFSYDSEGYGHLLAWLSLCATMPVITYCAWPIWRRFLTSLSVGILGMETLVAMGVASALMLSMYSLLTGGMYVYFDSMSVIIAFVLLGKIVESRAKFSAKSSLLRLSRSTPRRGRKRFSNGSLRFALIKEIEKEDVIVAYAGEKIAIDGIVIEDEGACDESLLTGEALPVRKKIGDLVLGGTILLQGRLVFKVTSTHEETALHKIIEMVERDIGRKSVYIRAADPVISWFVPAVIIFAALTVAFCLLFSVAGLDQSPLETALLRAIAILLISCPCAIGIAAPTAEAHLLNGLAALGVIIRNRGCLSILGCETVFIFDKTGTATEGRFSVISGLESLSTEERKALCGLASQSTHPIAAAVAVAATVEEGALPFEEIEEIAGQGLKGMASGMRYFLGSARFLALQGIVPLQEGACFSDGKEVGSIISEVYFAKGEQCLARLTLGDKVRPELEEVVAALKPVKTVLLSGDGEIPVAFIAKKYRFDEWRSGCTPLEKREYVEALRQKGSIVCMLGDGINDAPALTAAHIGISVVSASDMSIQVSDVLLTTDRLGAITMMRDLACKGQRIIRQNLFWAFFYNVIGISLAAFGILSPIFAAFAMSISSATVLLNAQRLSDNLFRFKSR